MWIETNLNSRAHNWLIHHLCIRSVNKYASHLRGKVLDIGCGSKPYQYILRKHCTQYIGLDHPTSIHGLEHVEVTGDAVDLPFESGAFDSVVSFQVMEHISEPSVFMTESFRVLKAGGVMLLATPFMWGEHEQPYDYFRYTRFGLAFLARKAGFEVCRIEADGGYVATIILMLNYSLNRLRIGRLVLFFYPIYFFCQLLALIVHRVDQRYFSAGTPTFTTILRKPG